MYIWIIGSLKGWEHEIFLLITSSALLAILFIWLCKIISHFFFKMENAVTESDRLSGIDENVCILHGNIWNMVLGIDKKYETLSINDNWTELKYDYQKGFKSKSRLFRFCKKSPVLMYVELPRWRPRLFSDFC